MGVYYKNENWYIDFRVNGRRRRQKIGPSKQLAENVLRKTLVEIAEDKYLDKRKENKIKFVDFAEEYLNIHAKRFRSYKKSGLNNVIVLIRHFQDKYLHEIKIKDVEEFKSKRMKEVSPATVNRQLSCLKSMFNRAKEWEKFNGKNPVCKVKLLKENNERVEYLNESEMKKIIEVSDDYFKPILIVALNTGMRRGEILALKWRDLDFHTKTIYIREAKSGEGRTIPMNNNVENALMKVRKHPDSEYVFVKKNGEKRLDLRKPFAKALKNAEIKRYFRFHDLRHTFASHLAMKGVSLNDLPQISGQFV